MRSGVSRLRRATQLSVYRYWWQRSETKTAFSVKLWSDELCEFLVIRQVIHV